MSSFPMEIAEYKFVCARCTAEGLSEPKGGCKGDCRSCGRFLDHGEAHADDCTVEEDYLAMMAAFEVDQV